MGRLNLQHCVYSQILSHCTAMTYQYVYKDFIEKFLKNINEKKVSIENDTTIFQNSVIESRLNISVDII